MVAVSKTKPVEAIREAYEAGQRHFGENYVQVKLSTNAVILTVPTASPCLRPALGRRRPADQAILRTAQEITDKAPELPDEIAWHFIGHLQSNKAKALLGGPLKLMVSALRALYHCAELCAACIP